MRDSVVAPKTRNARIEVSLSNKAEVRILNRAASAFIEYGYADLSMGRIAEYCDLTRRGLYHHFSSKEDIFRAVLKTKNDEALVLGDEASRTALARSASPVDVIAEWIDARFGDTRRELGASPHGRELNDTAFRLATDIMIEVSHVSNARLAQLVNKLCSLRRLRLRNGHSAEHVGRLLGDGARGVNQARPPIPNSEINQRYRDIVEAILFGCAKEACTTD